MRVAVARSSASSRLASRLLSMSAAHQFVLDPFALRQWDDPAYTGTKIDYEKAAFQAKINEFYESGKYPLVDGYAPFCKHLFVPNFVGAQLNYLEITPDNESKLRSGYDARTEQELAVLVRWFPAETAPTPAVADFLDVILYSREQIRKETEAMGKEDDGETACAPAQPAPSPALRANAAPCARDAGRGASSRSRRRASTMSCPCSRSR